MITEEIALEAIGKLEIAYNTKQKKGLEKIWVEELQDVSEKQFRKAVAWWIKHNDRFPTIRQLEYALAQVGGSGRGEKQEYYEWMEEDLSKRAVLYYSQIGNTIYTCVLAKGKDASSQPPQEFEGSQGQRWIREDIWEKERGENWKLENLKERKKTQKIKKRSVVQNIEELKERMVKQLKVLGGKK